MPTVAQQRHFVFLRTQPESHAAVNARVAGEFCKALVKGHGITARVLYAGFADDEPDAVVEVGGRRMAFEFTGYRQRDDFHDVEPADSAVLTAIALHLESSQELTAFHIRLDWRTEKRRNYRIGRPPRRPSIPLGPDRNGICHDLEGLVRLKLKECPAAPWCCCFSELTNHASLARIAARYRLLSPTEYPTLAKFCREIRLDPSEFWPDLRTSLSPRYLGLDRGELARLVGQKVTKAAACRLRAPDLPFWLIVHADGHPPSTRLIDHQIDDAVEVIRAHASEKPPFDEVWLATETGFLDATRAVRVLPIDGGSERPR